MNQQEPVVTCGMLIRKSVEAVFNALIDPEVTTQFWFTKSSGKMVEDMSVMWEWEMYGVSAETAVKKVIENECISFEWGEPKETVDFLFTPLRDNTATYVLVKNYGFQQTGDALVAKLIDTTGGFTTVLDGMKAWLEHGIRLNLVGDKFPPEFVNH